jgi:hypothetical protein
MIRITAVFVLVLFYLFFGSVITAKGQLTDMKVLQNGDTGQCRSTEKRERARKEIYQITNSTVAELLNTCGTLGWRRVAYFNMTNTNYSCPTGLNLTSYSKRTCGRSYTHVGCSSTKFSIQDGDQYSKVCGRMRGYQYGGTSAFASSNVGIDKHYVNGVSLTHGAAESRQHIWTFAAGLSEVTTKWPNHGCPCEAQADNLVPDFIGDDFFCESGCNTAWVDNGSYAIFYSDDVLWDGQDCTSNSTCCQLNSPPWFIKNLPNATTDDIELRICANYHYTFEDTAIELMELYIQ